MIYKINNSFIICLSFYCNINNKDIFSRMEKAKMHIIYIWGCYSKLS